MGGSRVDEGVGEEVVDGEMDVANIGGGVSMEMGLGVWLGVWLIV